MNSFNSPFAQFAARVLDFGYSPVPLHGKRPIFGKWDRLRFGALTPAEIEELCRKYGAMNLGVAGGFCGLAPIDVDTEDREIMLAVVKALPPVKIAKAGRKGFTAFYRDATGLIEGTKFRRPNGGGFDMLVEVLTTGQTVLPPSIHPETRRPYVWRSKSTLFNTGIDELPEITSDHVEALGKALRRWIPEPKPFTPRMVVRNAPTISGSRTQAYAQTILANEVRAISRLACGRNWALYSAGAKLGKFIAAGHLSEKKVITDLMSASETNGYSEAKGRKQAEATIKSGLRKGAGDRIH
jgi:hypothetical protein